MDRSRRFPYLGTLSAVLLACCQAVRAWAAGPTLVQSAGHDNGIVDFPTCTVTFPSNNTAGNVIVVAVEVGAAAAVHAVVVNDTQGNLYYPATAQTTWLNSGGGGSGANLLRRQHPRRFQHGHDDRA